MKKVSQNYALGFEKDVTPQLSYRFDWRETLTQSNETLGDESMDEDVHIKEPILGIRWTNPFHNLTADIRLTEEERKQEGSETNIVNKENFLVRYFLTPVDLPTLSLQYERRTNEDRVNIDTVNDEYKLGLAYEYSWAKMGYDFRFEKFEDLEKQIVDRTHEDIARFDFAPTFWKDRIQLSGNYFFRKNRESHTIGRPFIGDVTLRGRDGLFAAATADEINVTLRSEPTLVDGDLVTGTSINIGANGGEEDQQIGIDVGRPQKVDTLFIYTDVSLDISTASAFSWDVYRSDNNVQWTLIESNAGFIYDTTFLRFEISFIETTSRYFKVIVTSIPSFGDAIFVTEIEAVASEEQIEEGTSRFNELINSVSTILTYRPSDNFYVSYDIFVQEIDTDEKEETGEKLTREEIDFNQGFTLFLKPHRFFSNTLRFMHTEDKDTLLVDRTTDFYSYLLNTYFLDTLDISFTASHLEEQEEEEDSLEIDTLMAQAAAELYKDLTASVSFSNTDEEDFQTGIKTQLKTFNSSIFARPREHWEMIFDGLVQWTKTEGGDVESVSDRQINLDLEVIYRPSPLLLISVRPIYIEKAEGRGISHVYKIDWTPFPAGGLRFEVNYKMDRRMPEREQTESILARARWSMNRYTFFEVSYQTVAFTNDNDTIDDLFIATFNTTF